MIKSIKLQAILYAIGAAFFFALMSLFVRLAGEMPIYQKAFFRNIVALIFTSTAVIIKRENVMPKKGTGRFVFMRALFGTIGIVCNFLAIDNLNLSDSAILNKLSPVFGVVLCAIFLKEKLTKVDYFVLVLSFIGAICVVKPTFSIDSAYSYIGLLGGFAVGVAYMALRLCGKHGEKGVKIVFWFSAFSTAIFLPLFIIFYEPMQVIQVVFMCLAGLSASFAQICLTSAYTKVETKEVSVFDYTQVIFTALLGFIFLSQVPDIYSVIGYVLIISAAVYKWYKIKKEIIK